MADDTPEKYMVWTVEMGDGSAFDLAIPNTPEAHANLNILLTFADVDAHGEYRRDANAALDASAGF